jgi:LysM repeat protein
MRPIMTRNEIQRRPWQIHTLRVSIRWIAGILLILSCIMYPASHARSSEATAHITLEKGKTVKKDAQSYKIKRGDTLYSIVNSVFEPSTVKARKQIYDAIRQLNPRMTSINRIYAGQTIQLPAKTGSPGRRTMPSKKGIGIEGEGDAGAVQADSPPPPPDYRIAVVREVISRMRGTVTTTGTYFIPLPESGQVKIDCTRIPVAELPDGTVVLLDFSQRMPASLKKTLETHWPNYHLLAVSPKEETPRILQEVFNVSKAYSMTKMTDPIAIGKKPELLITTGWLIIERSARAEKNQGQLVTYINDGQIAFPKAFVLASKRNGLIITEVLIRHGVLDPPDIPSVALSIPDLAAPNSMELCAKLLYGLNIETSRNVDMKIFEQEKSGFDLSIKADLLAVKDNKRTIFHIRPIPAHFIEILKENGIETVYLDPTDSRRATIEKTLAAVKTPFSSTDFSFPFSLQSGKARGLVRFPAVRATTNQATLYMIDFDMDPDLYQWLHQQWGVNLIKY